MDFRNIRVLLLEGYARQILPMAKAFRELGCEVTTLNSSKLDVGYTSRYPQRKIIDVCSQDDYEGTVEVIRRLLQTKKYDLVVPMVDFSAAILSKYKEEFKQYAKIAAVDWKIYDIAQDKLKTMQVCMENGVPCPITITSVKSVNDIKASGMKYPIVAKPRVSYGAIGFRVLHTESELNKFFEKIDIDDYLFQEYIPQTDGQLDTIMFLDHNHVVKSSLVLKKSRWFPIQGGASTLNITVDRPDVIETCSKLLKAIDWYGCADIDLIQDPRDGVAKVVEINPRVSANVKISFEVGINLAKQIIEMEFGLPVTEYSGYPIGQRLRCSYTDFLWFIKSPDRFRAKPSWFSFTNTKDSIFSLSDPLPWFSFGIQGVMRYRREMKRRSGG